MGISLSNYHFIGSNRIKHLGSATTPIASERSEVPKSLSESHSSLPQGKPAVVSDFLGNPEKICFFRIIEVFESRPTKIDIGF